jgi:ribosomal protein L15
MANNESVEKIGLHNLSPAPGSHRSRRRLGRGPGSGLGKTSGKGHKGSMARSGHGGPGGGKPHFEGGQMPITRRIPKRGFTNPFREEAQVVRLNDLVKVQGDEVSVESLLAAGAHPRRSGCPQAARQRRSLARPDGEGWCASQRRCQGEDRSGRRPRRRLITELPAHGRTKQRGGASRRQHLPDA